MTMTNHTKRAQRVAHTMCCAAMLAMGAVAAQAPDANAPPPPPPEALAACKALASGQECSFKGPNGVTAGLCWAPKDKALACKPKYPPKDAPPPKP